MSSLKLTLLFLLISFCSYSQKNAEHKVNPEAVKFSKKIISLIPYTDNSDSCIKALSYLDSATSIDSSCFVCYYDKLMFLASLKKFEDAITAINECTRIKPNAHDLYLMGGMLYRKVKDTVNSNKYFQKSLAICNNVLDTMSSSNRDYEMFTGNKAINLIMLGDEKSGNEILKNLYDSLQNDKQFDTDSREAILLWMNKTPDQIMDNFLGPGDSLSEKSIQRKPGN